jgi:hypothetical protein
MMDSAGQTTNVESICCSPGLALLPLAQEPAQKIDRRQKERLE